MSVRPSTWNTSAPTRQFFLLNLVFKDSRIKVVLKSGKNNGTLPEDRYMYIYGNTVIPRLTSDPTNEFFG